MVSSAPRRPAVRRAAQHRGPADAAALVDRYQIECRPVRDVLVAYLREREPSVDHSTLTNLAKNLASRFWRDLERHHPGIDDLRLGPDVAAAWKDRVRYDHDGELLRGSPPILMAVRSFYLDIAQWSLGDPGRWSRWAAPDRQVGELEQLLAADPGLTENFDDRPRPETLRPRSEMSGRSTRRGAAAPQAGDHHRGSSTTGRSART